MERLESVFDLYQLDVVYHRRCGNGTLRAKKVIQAFCGVSDLM